LRGREGDVELLNPPGQERVLEPFDPTGQEAKGVWPLSRLVPFEAAACCRVVLAPLQYPGIWWPGLDPSPDQLLPEAFVAATTHRAGGGAQETGARKVEHGMVGCDQHRGHFGQPRNGGNEIEPNGAKHGLVTLVMIGGRVEALPRPYVVATYVASADDGSEIVFIGHQDRPDEHRDPMGKRRIGSGRHVLQVGSRDVDVPAPTDGHVELLQDRVMPDVGGAVRE